MSQVETYYQILGLKPGATAAEVKHAYRTLAKTWHPDLFPDRSQLKQQAEEEIKKINEAYQQLKWQQPHASRVAAASGTYSTYKSCAETYFKRGMENARRGRYSNRSKD